MDRRVFTPFTLAATCLLLGACAAGGAAPSPAEAARQAALDAPGKPGCFYPRDVRSWHDTRSDSLFVDAGRRKYRVDLWGECQGDLGVSLVFRGDAVTGRVCGNPSDRVITGPTASRPQACRIRQVREVDEETWALATGSRRLEGSATVKESPTR